MESSLKQNLLYSHSVVAALGIFLLLMSLGAVLWLKHDLEKLTAEVLPTVQRAENLKTQIQLSLTSLRGWMNVPDKKFLKERDEAWIHGIEPDLKYLMKLAVSSEDKLFIR